MTASLRWLIRDLDSKTRRRCEALCVLYEDPENGPDESVVSRAHKCMTVAAEYIHTDVKCAWMIFWYWKNMALRFLRPDLLDHIGAYVQKHVTFATWSRMQWAITLTRYELVLAFLKMSKKQDESTVKPMLTRCVRVLELLLKDRYDDDAFLLLVESILYAKTLLDSATVTDLSSSLSLFSDLTSNKSQTILSFLNGTHSDSNCSDFVPHKTRRVLSMTLEESIVAPDLVLAWICEAEPWMKKNATTVHYVSHGWWMYRDRVVARLLQVLNALQRNDAFMDLNARLMYCPTIQAVYNDQDHWNKKLWPMSAMNVT